MRFGSLSPSLEDKMSMDNIRVGIRVRPINEREVEDPASVWRYDDSSITLVRDGQPTNSYTFDYVFGNNSQTIDIYNSLAKYIIDSALQGVNGTIFAYGQTSSGKTHTMKGGIDSPGIIPLAISEIFSFIQQTPEREFLLRVSYLEIYNEEIRDLLCPSSTKLEIREDIERGVFVKDAKEEIVVTPQQALQLMASGEEHRHVGATGANSHSSRSHTIFKMVIESREKSKDGQGTKKSLDGAVKVSMLNLVDLAGSERLSHTLATGVRMVEGCKINQSLSNLGTVISKLAEGERGHVPYRNSKLTRILEPALGGNSRTAVICTIAPAFRDESISTLKFANRAKQIKNKPIVNEVMDQASMLKRYRQQISKLKKELKNVESKGKNWQELESQKLKAEEDKEIMMQMLRDAEIEKEKQREKLARMTNMIITSSTVAPPIQAAKLKAKSNRRETWAPNRVMGDAYNPFIAIPSSAGAGEEEDLEGTPVIDFIPRARAEFAVPFPVARARVQQPPAAPVASAPPASVDNQEAKKLKEELQVARQQLQQLQDANLRLESELQDEKEKARQQIANALSQVGDKSAPEVDAMAQASAFIHQLQLELDDTRQKLEEQGDMNELLTEDVVNMGKQIEELSSQYEISESTSRQFQEQALHLEQTLGMENATLQKQVQEQAQQLQELTAQYEASQKAAQEHQEQGLRYREEAASLGEQNNLAQTRLTELEEENAQLQQEKQRLQDTLTVLREEHSVSQTKLHTSYNKKIDQLEIKLSTLEKEREEQEREHQEEAAQAAAQRSSLAIIEQDLERLQGDLTHAKEDNDHLKAMLKEALTEKENAQRNLQIARAEGEILRNQKGFNDSSFSGASANSRRFSIAPAAFQEAKIKEDLKSTTVKKNQLQQENDGLRKEKEKALKDMGNLDTKFKQAVKERSVLQGEKVTLERELKRLMSQNTGLEKQMEKMKSKENKIKEERDQRLQVEKQLAALTKTHEKLQAQLAEAQSTLKLKEDTLNKLSADFMSLNGLNGELERKNCDREEEIARLQATIKKLSDDVTELVSTIEKLKTTLQTKSESLSIKETHLAATLKEKEHLQTQGNAMQEKIAAQTNDLVLFDRKVQAMTMDLNNLQAQLQASDRQKNSLQQQLVGLNHRLSLTEQQLEGVRREKALGDERYDLLQKEKKDLEQRLADLMKEKAGLEEQLATSRKEKAAVDEQLTETFFSFEQMKTEWGSKESGYCLQLEQLTTELRDRVDCISRLENDKACLLGEQEELQQLREQMVLEIDALAAGNKSKEAELCEMQAQLETLEALMSETKEELHKITAERNGLTGELATAHSDVAMYKSNLAEVCEVLPQLESSQAQLTEELAKTKEELLLASEERDALIDELATTHADNSAQRSELQAQLKASEARLHESMAKATEERQIAAEERSALIEELATAHATKTQLEEAHAQLQGTEAQLREALTQAKQELHMAAEERDRLAKELTAAHAKSKEDKAFNLKETRHLERQLKKKDKEIKQYSDLVASTKSAIDTLERDQQELAIIKHKGCTNCGSRYSAPDPSLFPPEPTQTFVALGAGGQRATSPKKQRPAFAELREEKAEEEDSDEAESPLAGATTITSQTVSSSVAAPVDAAPKSGLERMQALKEKARRMKESNNRSTSCARIPATTTQPKSILKRRAATTTDDDKENFINA